MKAMKAMKPVSPTPKPNNQTARTLDQAVEQLFFSLEEKRFEAFTALLEAPFKHNKELARLLAIKAPWNAA